MNFKSEVFEKINNSKNNFKLYGSFYKEKESILIIKASGYLETANSDIFSNSILKILDKNKNIKLFILDLKKINYVSSTGIGALIRIISELKKRDKNIYWMNLNEKVYSIIDLLGFTKFFRILNSENELDAVIKKEKAI
jgi:anti-sigma B factor antagonist